MKVLCQPRLRSQLQASYDSVSKRSQENTSEAGGWGDDSVGKGLLCRNEGLCPGSQNRYQIWVWQCADSIALEWELEAETGVFLGFVS